MYIYIYISQHFIHSFTCGVRGVPAPLPPLSLAATARSTRDSTDCPRPSVVGYDRMVSIATVVFSLSVRA